MHCLVSDWQLHKNMETWLFTSSMTSVIREIELFFCSIYYIIVMNYITYIMMYTFITGTRKYPVATDV